MLRWGLESRSSFPVLRDEHLLASRVDKPSIVCAGYGAHGGSTRPRYRNAGAARPHAPGPCRQAHRERPTGRHLHVATTFVFSNKFGDCLLPPVKARRATTVSRPVVRTASAPVLTMRQSSSPTAALPQPQGHLAGIPSAVGMSRSSSSARLIAGAHHPPALLPISR